MIRPMQTSDIDLIIEAELDIFGHTLGKEMIEKEITKHDFAHYFILEDQAVLGYVGLWINDDIGQIVNFLIRKPFQGKGYGKQLLTFVMSYFEQAKTSIISLEVRESNYTAIKLYEQFGFVKSYKREKYYDNKEDAFVMIWRDKNADIGSRK